MFGLEMEQLGKTSIELEGKVCGAEGDKRGPIGGGHGCLAMIEAPSKKVSGLDELLVAVAEAKSGDVIYIDGDAEIDLTTRVHIEELVLELAEGVTLASDRGQNGSPGGLIVSDTSKTKPLIRIKGAGVRITGLRIQGPTSKRHIYHVSRSVKMGPGEDYYYKFPLSDGIETDFDELEVDNCELAGWSHAAIFLWSGTGHHIHHNFIHHNQYQGLGYGVCLCAATAVIERNQFNYNRHSIAGSGHVPSGYEASHNVELGESLSHCFDMHGGRDRQDGTEIAGTWMKVHHNTFRCPQTEVVIRGAPEEMAEIHNNWMYHAPDKLSVRSDGNTEIRNNAYGMKKPEFRAIAEPSF